MNGKKSKKSLKKIKTLHEADLKNVTGGIIVRGNGEEQRRNMFDTLNKINDQHHKTAEAAIKNLKP